METECMCLVFSGLFARLWLRFSGVKMRSTNITELLGSRGRDFRSKSAKIDGSSAAWLNIMAQTFAWWMYIWMDECECEQVWRCTWCARETGDALVCSNKAGAKSKRVAVFWIIRRAFVSSGSAAVEQRERNGNFPSRSVAASGSCSSCSGWLRKFASTSTRPQVRAWYRARPVGLVPSDWGWHKLCVCVCVVVCGALHCATAIVPACGTHKGIHCYSEYVHCCWAAFSRTKFARLRWRLWCLFDRRTIFGLARWHSAAFGNPTRETHITNHRKRRRVSCNCERIDLHGIVWVTIRKIECRAIRCGDQRSRTKTGTFIDAMMLLIFPGQHGLFLDIVVYSQMNERKRWRMWIYCRNQTMDGMQNMWIFISSIHTIIICII